jgi:ADP-ribosylglycohydrolase
MDGVKKASFGVFCEDFSMQYSKIPDFGAMASQMTLYAQLGVEYQAEELGLMLREMERTQKKFLAQLKKLKADKKLSAAEPDSLAGIRKLRPTGPRRMWETFDRKKYLDRVEGAMLARIAGCTLGVPVEMWSLDAMEKLARESGMAFPPTDYWTYVPDPYCIRYGVSKHEDYTRDKMNGVPVDDDITYTLLGLLIAENYGLDFTVGDVGEAWMKYLPMACTAEEIALKNLKKGVPAEKAAEKDNPFCQWIGADIRSDPWGYMAPGCPELAAEMAYHDAYLSHRRNGIYGEMFFSAVISAAFAVDDPIEALKIGLTEIPCGCELAKAVKWALNEAKNIHDYKSGRAAVDERFAGMSRVHTTNNACLTIFGLAIGGTDVTKVISETVAMGLDNDCTAATAGSIVGAVVGKAGVPAHWTKPFKNTVHSYLIGEPKFKITDLVRRFAAQAMRAYENR